MRGQIKDGRPPDQTPVSREGLGAMTRNHDPTNGHIPTTLLKMHMNLYLTNDTINPEIASFYNITTKCKIYPRQGSRRPWLGVLKAWQRAPASRAQP
jgi:hypothetical protein